MNDFEGLHGNWQHMTGEEVEEALRGAGEAEEAAQSAVRAGEDIALAAGGEGALELAIAGAAAAEILEPLDEAGRDALRRDMATSMDRPHISIDKLEPGPNGQYITGSPGA